jgi:hypothetical protein
MPATKHAARNARKMTNNRPISAIGNNHQHLCHCEERSDEAIQSSRRLMSSRRRCIEPPDRSSLALAMMG